MPFDIINVQTQQAEALLKASSWLSYRGLLLADVLTEHYEAVEVRSEDGSQKIATHHTIKVIGILNPGVNSYIQLGAENSPPGRMAIPSAVLSQNISLIRDWLLVDRGLLQYSVGGNIIVQSPALAAPGVLLTTDSGQGPKPLYVHITQITGTGSYYVRFGIECWTDACAITGQFANLVQSHRFSMAHDVDGDTWLTTRMVTGHLKFRAEVLAIEPEIAPDQMLEQNFFHPIPPGFKRQNVKVQAHPNGMELAYSFVDSEQPLPLGSASPATKLAAEFSLSSSMAEGKPALTQAAVHVGALGPKNQYRMNLLVMAMRIALRKLQKPGLVLINEVIVTYSLDNRFVDLSLRAIWKPVGIGMEGLRLDDAGLKAEDDVNDLDDALSGFRTIAEPPQGSQSNSALSPKSSYDGRKGTYLGLCIGSSLVNGCLNFTQPKNWIIATSNDKVAEFTPDPDQTLLQPMSNNREAQPFDLEVTDLFTIQLLSTGLSNEITEGVGLYEDWQMATRYHTNHLKAVLPVGAKQAESPGSTEYTFPQVATLGLPYTLKVVDWTVAWIGPDANAIILPSPDTGDSNDVLLCEDITPASPSAVNSSFKAWRVSGTFYYLSKRMRSSSMTTVSQFTAPTPDQGFSPGRGITDPQIRADNTIGLSRFMAGYAPSFVG